MRKWSKLKKSMEERLAESLQGRVQYHVTHYGKGDSYTKSRGWITLDGRELLNAATSEALIEFYRIAHEVREINRTTDYRDAAQKQGYYESYDQASQILLQDGRFSLADFDTACEAYLSLSIDDAITSDNILIRAFSMLDRRLGKRRISSMTLLASEHPLVRQFYELRVEAEGD